MMLELNNEPGVLGLLFGGQKQSKTIFSCPYLVQTIHFFRGVNDSITSATRRIHVGGALSMLASQGKPPKGAGRACVPPRARVQKNCRRFTVMTSGVFEADPGGCCYRYSRRTAGCHSTTQTRKARRRRPPISAPSPVRACPSRKGKRLSGDSFLREIIPLILDIKGTTASLQLIYWTETQPVALFSSKATSVLCACSPDRAVYMFATCRSSSPSVLA